MNTNTTPTISTDPKQWMWERKYAPKTLAECILPEEDRKIFQGIIDSGSLSSTTFVSRSPGTGKTTIAKVLVNELDAEMYFVNGADCKIDFIRNELTRFASTMTSKPGGKIIVIDEFDRKGLKDAQDHLRSFSEAYSHNCTIILTANNEDGISDALKSRAPVVTFGNATDDDKVNMMKRMIIRCLEILKLENVPVEDPRVVAALVKLNFPDFRKTIKELDRYSKKGVIDSGILAKIQQASDIQVLVDAIKAKEFKTIRGLVDRYVHDYPTFITKLYETLYEQAQPTSIPNLILTIGDNQKYYSQVANLEIHISMMLIQLMMETTWK